MQPTQVIRLFQADGQGVGNQLFSGRSVMLVAGVVLAAIIFFSMNPFRVGEITVATPNGPSVTVKVANSNEISELIQKGLENEKTASSVTNSLMSIIEKLPVGSELGDKLMDLAEQRKNPFKINSVPVTLVYDPSLPDGWAAVCEESDFSGKNIVVFVQGKGELLPPIHAYADAKIVFPCSDGDEIVRLNSTKILQLNRDKAMAKRDL